MQEVKALGEKAQEEQRVLVERERKQSEELSLSLEKMANMEQQMAKQVLKFFFHTTSTECFINASNSTSNNV